MKKYYRSSRDKKIAGVCGGLAEYFNMDPLLVRLLVFLLIWCGTVGIWLYILLWILAPSDKEILY